MDKITAKFIKRELSWSISFLEKLKNRIENNDITSDEVLKLLYDRLKLLNTEYYQYEDIIDDIDKKEEELLMGVYLHK